MASSPDDEDVGVAGVEGEDGRAPREDTPPAPCAAFCGPRACSTLPPNLPAQPQPATSEPKRRRLWGLRGLVKMFRRRVRRRAGESDSPQPSHATMRARSASELAVDVQHRCSSGPYNQGLSVSHDSVFTPDAAADTRHTRAPPPALAIATRGVNMAELKAVLRRRRGDDSGSGEDDPGLPRSPPTSPTTLDVLTHGLKSCSRATHSTCSDASLLSMGSSENDEDSLGPASHHSSRASLLDHRHTVVDHEPVAGAVPLSHHAAHHKIAIRPKRTHGAPRMRKSAQIGGQSSLPTTPEVNEDTVKVVAAPAPSPTRPHAPTGESSIAQSQPTSVEAHSPEKPDDKKDEPLFQRLLGSVRTGRRRSRGSGDDSRENSVSPLRREVDQRPSRDKKRDSSGSRFSVLGRSSSKNRTDTHLPPSGKAKEVSQEPQQRDSSPPQTPRSSSVEGRLETTGQSPLKSTIQISSYNDRSSKAQVVRKVKSFREVGASSEVHRESVHRRISAHSNVEEHISSSKISRISASFESVEHERGVKPSESNSTRAVEVTTSKHRSSTDSLTTTQIPGVFIRQHSQNVGSVMAQKHQDFEPDSGPLSLDSSFTLQPREMDDHLRKSTSVDQVSNVVEIEHHKSVKSKRASHDFSTESRDNTPTHSNQIMSTSMGAEERKSRLRNSEEAEDDGENVPRRPLRKEPSLKRAPPREVSPNPVPEFMRIQLNRVENKGQTVVFDTEQDKSPKSDVKDTDISKTQINSYVFVKDVSYKDISPSDTAIGATVHKSEYKEPNTSSLSKRTSPQGTKAEKRDASPSNDSLNISDQDSGQEVTTPDSTVERVVLRRPLVTERTPVMERANSVTNQYVPKVEQPELFKVFARRSFKTKDSDKIKSDESDLEDMGAEVASEVSEVTVFPTRVPTNPDPESLSKSPVSIAAHQKPNINAISFNRRSIGNPAISFCPPPVAIGNVIDTFPASTKPTVLTVSSDGAASQASAEAATHPITSSTRTVASVTSLTSSSVVSSVSRNVTTISTSSVTAPIHGPTVRSFNPTLSSDCGITVVTSSNSVVSKIINNRALKELKEKDAGSEVIVESPQTIKPSGPSRQTPSVVWPPRTQSQDQLSESPPAVHMSHVQKKPSRSLSVTSDTDEVRHGNAPQEGPVEVSPLDIGAARRRFMSGGRERPAPSTTPPSQNTLSLSTPFTPPSPGITSPKPSPSPGAESRGAPSFTVSVRTQSPPINVHLDRTPPTNDKVTPSNTHTDKVSSTDVSGSPGSSSSPGKVEGGVVQQAADDWRVLVRQRREGRLKQSKTPDTEEIIIESRPQVARNSKVLEMANNFQKLQVA